MGGVGGEGTDAFVLTPFSKTIWTSTVGSPLESSISLACNVRIFEDIIMKIES